ncbi:MAG TPA: AAA family ATPase, partial [Acidimicrobiales bacterium]|nr:AAA family ATPase [Acidimicrobiales bacterium]
MFLKSLTLKGFKSFADTTTLEFEPGVTVVVGPNGSGKSNVVDAVAWVLGAQGPRALRSSKMEDVIFAGTPKRAALGRAEVSLTIDNSAGLLPIEFSEVTITRTLFRTGESEYAINRVPCRLLDVQDLLSDTGVGRQQHVIVSQGNLDAILTSRPEERRLIIEEAAGVLKYRRRKERSERRLEATEASLLRLQDLLREVRRQLRPLEKQAEAARRHDGLAAELGALRRHLAGRDLVAVQARLTSAAERGAELARAESEVRSALAAFDAEVIAGEAELSARRRKGEELDLAEVVSRAERIRARAAGAVALLDQRRRSLERELVATLDEDVIASLESESASLAAQLEAVATEAAGLGPQRAEVAQAEEHLAAETDAVEAQWGAEGRAPADPAAEARGELGARRVAIDRARAEQRRLESRAAAAAGRRDRLAEESMRLRSEAEEVDARAAGLNAAAEEAAAAATEADAALAAAEERRRTADAALHHWQARAEALAQALDQARARAGAERLASVTGVVGTLLELVQVDEGWEAAFEAAAGEALAAVVVDSGEAAGRALEELRRGGDAGAVLSLGGGVPAPAAPPPPGVAAVRGAVRSRLPAVNALLDRLLAPAVHVPDFATAVDLAGRRPDLVVVTSEGDRFAGGLWRTGVGGTGATGAALDEAQEKAAAARAHAARAAADAAEARRTLEERAAAAARREGERAAAEARRRTLSDATARVDVELTDAAGEADAAERQKAEAAERLAAESARVDELAVLLPALEAEAAEAAERVLAARAARDRLVERAAAVAGMRRELEVRAAGLEERRQLLERRRDDVDARLANLGSQRATAAARRQRLEREVMAVTALATLAAGLEPALAGALDRLRAARRAEAAATAEAS